MVGVVGAAVTGRKDLPAACRVVGTQLGRVVGLLQGARARADQFTAKNELRQLQNELRSGLRELDQVRTELAVAASSQGLVGRTLGATTPSANRRIINPVAPNSIGPPPGGAVLGSRIAAASLASTSPLGVGLVGSTGIGDESENQTIAFDLPSPDHKIPIASLASHSEKAALEDEWEKQGIGYQTRAEQIYKQQTINTSGGPLSGSELLESLIKQNLIWDQYDRVVGEQDSQLQGRVEAMKAKRQGKDDGTKTNDK